MASVALSAQEPAQNKQSVAIRAASLIDGKSDTAVKDAVVLVVGEKIPAVGSGLAIPANPKIIDLGDATLLPGLIDAHTHLLMEMDELKRIVAGRGDVTDRRDAEYRRTSAARAKLGKEDLEAGITTVAMLETLKKLAGPHRRAGRSFERMFGHWNMRSLCERRSGRAEQQLSRLDVSANTPLVLGFASEGQCSAGDLGGTGQLSSGREEPMRRPFSAVWVV